MSDFIKLHSYDFHKDEPGKPELINTKQIVRITCHNPSEGYAWHIHYEMEFSNGHSMNISPSEAHELFALIGASL